MRARLILAAIGFSLMAGLPAAAQQTAALAAGPQNSATQNTTKPIAFDVISVKPNRSGATGESMRMTRDGFAAINIEVHDLLLQAFELQEGPQLVGDPKWTSSDRWDIDARIEPEEIDALAKMTFRQHLGMFQQILVERFGLKFHNETRELPVYALVVAKNGSKMTASTLRPNDSAGIQGEPGLLRPGRGKETGRGTTMEFLAEDLSDVLARKVVDHTGLTRRYDFTLTWAPDDDATSMGSAAPEGPSLFTAVQEQLGLKLEPAKAPVDVVVIDHIEKPAEN